MGGIAGILCFERDAIDDGLLKLMAEAASYRGPNGFRYRVGQHFGLAYLDRNPIPENGSWCRSWAGQESECWIAADARIDNQDAVLRALRGEGITLDNPTDAEVILAAYKVWGTTCPRRMVGDFAFVIWDRPRNCLFAARDHMGARPFYYHYAPGRYFLLASECKQLLQHPDISRRLNEPMIAAHLMPWPGQLQWSFYADISQLPPAHILVLDNAGLRIEPYWDIDPIRELYYQSDSEYDDHFVRLLEEVVSCRLQSSGRVGVLLSGGLDSGSIASIAGRLTKGGGASSPLRAFNWGFEELAECDERVYSTHVVEAYNLVPEVIWSDDHWLFSDYGKVQITPDDPTLLVCPPILHATLRRAQEIDVDVILMGTGANSLLGGNFPTYYDQLHAFRWLSLLRDLYAHRRLESLSWPRLLWRHLLKPNFPETLGPFVRGSKQSKLPKWIHPDFSRRIDWDWIKREGLPRKGFRSRSKSRRYQAVVNEMETRTCLAEGRLFSEYGVDHRLPFRDVRLFEFLMAVPPDQIWRAGEPKHLLRRAMKGILPEIVRTRRSIGSIGLLRTVGLQSRGRKILEKLLEKPISADFGYLDAGIFAEEYRRYCLGMRSEYPLNYAIELELWLRQMFDAQWSGGSKTNDLLSDTA